MTGDEGGDAHDSTGDGDDAATERDGEAGRQGTRRELLRRSTRLSAETEGPLMRPQSLEIKYYNSLGMLAFDKYSHGMALLEA